MRFTQILGLVAAITAIGVMAAPAGSSYQDLFRN